jgi:hypothetical protein
VTRRDLVIARVGRRSLHPTWVDTEDERGWDLYLSPFQDIAPSCAPGVTMGEVIPGPKWTGLRRLLNEWSGWRDYAYIWLPDDDILTHPAAISAMFAAASRLNFRLFAPALQEGSHYAHYITMRNRNFFARRVGFVEIMVPGFRRETLEELLPTLDLSTTGWGWGLDALWPKLLDYRGLGIIDAVSMLHTRAVGAFRDADLNRRVHEESDKITSAGQCNQQMVTFAGIGPDGQDLALSPDELLVQLADGWRYLQERDRSVLRWIVEQQAAHFDFPPYPVGGSPASPL